MRWQGRRESENVEDRRDEGGAYDDGGGGGFGFPFPGGGGGGFQIPMGQGGGGGIIGLIIIAGLALLLGVDPRMILNGGGGEEMPGGRHIQLPSDPRERTYQRRRRQHEEIRLCRAGGYGRHLEQDLRR